MFFFFFFFFYRSQETFFFSCELRNKPIEMCCLRISFIVYGPSNITIVIFVCSFDVSPASYPVPSISYVSTHFNLLPAKSQPDSRTSVDSCYLHKFVSSLISGVSNPLWLFEVLQEVFHYEPLISYLFGAFAISYRKSVCSRNN